MELHEEAQQRLPYAGAGFDENCGCRDKTTSGQPSIKNTVASLNRTLDDDRMPADDIEAYGANFANVPTRFDRQEFVNFRVALLTNTPHCAAITSECDCSLVDSDSLGLALDAKSIRQGLHGFLRLWGRLGISLIKR